MESSITLELCKLAAAKGRHKDQPEQPPNLRMAPFDVAKCMSCAHYDKASMCIKYKYPTDPNMVCDEYKPAEMDLPDAPPPSQGSPMPFVSTAQPTGISPVAATPKMADWANARMPGQYGNNSIQPPTPQVQPNAASSMQLPQQQPLVPPGPSTQQPNQGNPNSDPNAQQQNAQQTTSGAPFKPSPLIGMFGAQNPHLQAYAMFTPPDPNAQQMKMGSKACLLTKRAITPELAGSAFNSHYNKGITLPKVNYYMDRFEHRSPQLGRMEGLVPNSDPKFFKMHEALRALRDRMTSTPNTPSPNMPLIGNMKTTGQIEVNDMKSEISKGTRDKLGFMMYSGRPVDYILMSAIQDLVKQSSHTCGGNPGHMLDTRAVVCTDPTTYKQGSDGHSATSRGLGPVVCNGGQVVCIEGSKQNLGTQHNFRYKLGHYRQNLSKSTKIAESGAATAPAATQPPMSPAGLSIHKPLPVTPPKPLVPQKPSAQPMQSGSGGTSITPKMANTHHRDTGEVLCTKHAADNPTVDYSAGKATMKPMPSPVAQPMDIEAIPERNRMFQLGGGGSSSGLGDIGEWLGVRRAFLNRDAAAMHAEQQAWKAKYAPKPNILDTKLPPYMKKADQYTGPAYNNMFSMPDTKVHKGPWRMSDKYNRDLSDNSMGNMLGKAAIDTEENQEEKPRALSRKAKILSTVGGMSPLLGADVAAQGMHLGMGVKPMTGEALNTHASEINDLATHMGLDLNHLRRGPFNMPAYHRQDDTHFIHGVDRYRTPILAHELGHAKINDVLMNKGLSPLAPGYTVPYSSIGLLGSTAGSAAGAAGSRAGMYAGTAAILPLLAHELAASHVGGRALSSMRGGPLHHRVGNYLGAYSGIPSYAALTAAPYLSYKLGDILRRRMAAKGNKASLAKQAQDPVGVARGGTERGWLGGMAGMASPGLSFGRDNVTGPDNVVRHEPWAWMHRNSPNGLASGLTNLGGSKPMPTTTSNPGSASPAPTNTLMAGSAKPAPTQAPAPVAAAPKPAPAPTPAPAPAAAPAMAKTSSKNLLDHVDEFLSKIAQNAVVTGANAGVSAGTNTPPAAAPAPEGNDQQQQDPQAQRMAQWEAQTGRKFNPELARKWQESGAKVPFHRWLNASEQSWNKADQAAAARQGKPDIFAQYGAQRPSTSRVMSVGGTDWSGQQGNPFASRQPNPISRGMQEMGAALGPDAGTARIAGGQLGKGRRRGAVAAQPQLAQPQQQPNTQQPTPAQSGQGAARGGMVVEPKTNSPGNKPPRPVYPSDPGKATGVIDQKATDDIRDSGQNPIDTGYPREPRPGAGSAKPAPNAPGAGGARGGTYPGTQPNQAAPPAPTSPTPTPAPGPVATTPPRSGGGSFGRGMDMSGVGGAQPTAPAPVPTANAAPATGQGMPNYGQAFNQFQRSLPPQPVQQNIAGQGGGTPVRTREGPQQTGVGSTVGNAQSKPGKMPKAPGQAPTMA